MLNRAFWNKKKVFITGHTGFKGTWLCLWLKSLGAQVTGYSIDIPTNPSLFKLAKPDVRTIWGDIRNVKRLKEAISKVKPDIVFHLAAQPLVHASYDHPIITYETNVLGTANILEALRGSSVKAAVIITTDKVYENNEKGIPYQESDPLGGYDPYSASKAAAEIVVSSYRDSFFNIKDYGKKHSTLIASARAGNVIGGGDFAQDRLLPDLLRAILSGKNLKIRHPLAIRPWQHVLESLLGYLLLGEKLCAGKKHYAEAFNFGPEQSDVKPVEWIVKRMYSLWGSRPQYSVVKAQHSHEAQYLRLDITKVKKNLGWRPQWRIEKALDMTVAWARAYQNKQDIAALCKQQIKEYTKGQS